MSFVAGDTLTIAFGGDNADQFYISSMNVVPAPGTLIILCLGLVSLVVARKKA